MYVVLRKLAWRYWDCTDALPLRHAATYPHCKRHYLWRQLVAISMDFSYRWCLCCVKGFSPPQSRQHLSDLYRRPPLCYRHLLHWYVCYDRRYWPQRTPARWNSSSTQLDPMWRAPEYWALVYLASHVPQRFVGVVAGRCQADAMDVGCWHIVRRFDCAYPGWCWGVVAMISL